MQHADRAHPPDRISASTERRRGLYIVIVLAALVCATVLAVQTIRREQPQDRMRVAAIGGGTSVGMILGAYLIFNLAELPLILTALIASLGLLALWTGIFGARLNERTNR